MEIQFIEVEKLKLVWNKLFLYEITYNYKFVTVLSVVNIVVFLSVL